MTDDLDKLISMMDAATPTPDANRRAANVALAQENFVAAQGTGATKRPTVKRGPLVRLSEGAKLMLNALSHRGVLTATTAIAAVALVVILPQTRDTVVQPSFRVEDHLPQPVAELDREEVAPSQSPEVLLDEASEPVATSKRQETALSQADQSTIRIGRGAVMEAPAIVAVPAERSLSTRIEQNTEAFSNGETNPLKVTLEDPVSTFSIDVDTASYSIVRSSLLNGHLPPPEAVRVEEMVNYFPYSYPVPKGDAPFRPSITVSPTPWNEATQLVHIGIQGALPEIADRPPLNLVFLIDTSGSMQDPNKLPLLKQSFRLLLAELRPEDQVSIVTYAGSAGQVLAPTSATKKSKILNALDKLQAGGSTAGQAGLQQAYQVAETMGSEGEVTRVLLATDGDFNVGLSDPEALKDFIARKRDSGTYLSVLGFGRGNLDDATMQALAQNGNGQAVYIDTLGEARKVLVDQLTGALFPIANDVKIQVEFNPAQIAEYRLIGYETRALRREDFSNDKVDAGDIGAGHSVTAIYEVTPVGSDAIRNGPLRYGEQAVSNGSEEIGFFKMRYKEPGAQQSRLIEQPILSEQGEITDDVRFSYAIAGFGQLLRAGAYLGGWTFDDAIRLANTARGEDPFGYRAEAVTLMRLAQSLGR
ncbi:MULTISPECIES: VWA domain-containing protein [unclassified Ruegeria]|uniref:vWA domain-containing protein n=1 Tax=unclassified Ruegeria TaxID=2625375 RepID=UPI001487BC9A|nr:MULTISPECIES: VWA domain-containing protein [unclassified Ruegeria]